MFYEKVNKAPDVVQSDSTRRCHTGLGRCPQPDADGTWGVHFLTLRFAGRPKQGVFHTGHTRKGQAKLFTTVHASSGSPINIYCIRGKCYASFNPATVIDPDDWRAVSWLEALNLLAYEVHPLLTQYFDGLATIGAFEILRLDIARDFVLSGDITPPPTESARIVDIHYRSGRVTGFELRRRRDGSKHILYDKYEKHRRKQIGEKPSPGTWRYEAQLRRKDDALPALTVGDVDDDVLWNLLEQSWRASGIGTKVAVDPVAAALERSWKALDPVIAAVLSGAANGGHSSIEERGGGASASSTAPHSPVLAPVHSTRPEGSPVASPDNRTPVFSGLVQACSAERRTLPNALPTKHP